MSRGEVVGFLREHWISVSLGLIAVGGWIARAEYAFAAIGGMQRAQTITESLARLECLRDRERATLAGVPCGTLLYYTTAAWEARP